MEKQVANVQLMQKMNRVKVLDYVRKNPDCSRPLISKSTGLSLASITNIVTYLLDAGLLTENGTEKVGRVGRKSTLLKFNSSAYDLICIFLSENQMDIYISDLLGNSKKKLEIPTNSLSVAEVMTIAEEKTNEIINECGREKFLAVGVAISGLVLENDQFVISSKLKWKSYDFKSRLERSAGIPVFVNNVSFFKAMHHFDSKKYSCTNMLFADLENGIGAVQYFNGQLNRSTLGEIGHTTVEKDGESCFCGNRGCLEAMCSPKQLISLCKSPENAHPSSLAEIENLFSIGDKTAVYAVKKCAQYLGIGFANLINLFNPSILVINTGDFADCPSLIDNAVKELYQRAIPALTDGLLVKKIYEAQDASIYGMARDLCDRFFDVSTPNNLL